MIICYVYKEEGIRKYSYKKLATTNQQHLFLFLNTVSTLPVIHSSSTTFGE
jgi:hypothetical protein